MPGSIRLQENNLLKEIIINHNKQFKLIGAICAAPAIVLSNYGILQGKTVTCYPASQFQGHTLCLISFFYLTCITLRFTS